jgi:hypothetical protein
VHDAISTRRKLFLSAVAPRLDEVKRSDRQIAVVMVQAMVTGSCVHRASQGLGVEDGLTWDQFAQQLEAIAMAYLLESD